MWQLDAIFHLVLWISRVALYNISRELTKDTPKSQAINKAERVSLFKVQFAVCCESRLSEEYFSRVGDRESQFDHDASHILTAFGKKWHPAGAREEYVCTFSKSKWEQLLKSLKVQYSLQKCEACYDNYYSFQQLFAENQSTVGRLW